MLKWFVQVRTPCRITTMNEPTNTQQKKSNTVRVWTHNLNRTISSDPHLHLTVQLKGEEMPEKTMVREHVPSILSQNHNDAKNPNGQKSHNMTHWIFIDGHFETGAQLLSEQDDIRPAPPSYEHLRRATGRNNRKVNKLALLLPFARKQEKYTGLESPKHTFRTYGSKT